MNSGSCKKNVEHAPRVIAWETTRRCALACKHCRGSARDMQYAGEFETEEFIKTIDSIASFSKPILILTGGEPMTRPDIYEIASYATKQGLHVVMAPCGHLITPETAKKLKESGVRAISISIDGATEESHDAFRGVPGAYSRTLKGLQYAIDAGIPFQVNTTVTKQNADDLPALLEQAIYLGAKTFDLFFLVPTGRGAELRDLEISADKQEELLNWVYEADRDSPIRVKTTCAPHYARIQRTRRGQDMRAGGGMGHGAGSMEGGMGHGAGGMGHGGEIAHGSASAMMGKSAGHPHGQTGAPYMSGGCMGGKGFVFISHTGILQPCGFLDVQSGNLRAVDYDFKKAYLESKVFNDLRNEDGYQGKCGICEFRYACGGCRARAYANTGNYLEEEPGCSYKGKNI